MFIKITAYLSGIVSLSLCTVPATPVTAKSVLQSTGYAVPKRTADNIIVAAYNIQWIGQKKHDLKKLATVIQHFDVCGIVEVKGEMEIVRLANELNTLTGKDWGYVFGVRTWRPKGNYHEAYAALWRRDRVQLGNGIVSNFWDLEEKFRNDPFIVSFKRKNFDFSLALIHTRWTDDDEGTRADEVAMMAEQINWMRGFIQEEDILIAGDFNYPGSHQNMKAMANAAGLVQLDKDPKTTFKSNNSGYASSYDHIYAIDGNTSEHVVGQCFAVDATKLVFGNNSKTSMKNSKSQLSDHLPIWAEFTVTGPDDD